MSIIGDMLEHLKLSYKSDREVKKIWRARDYEFRMSQDSFDEFKEKVISRSDRDFSPGDFNWSALQFRGVPIVVCDMKDWKLERKDVDVEEPEEKGEVKSSPVNLEKLKILRANLEDSIDVVKKLEKENA